MAKKIMWSKMDKTVLKALVDYHKDCEALASWQNTLTEYNKRAKTAKKEALKERDLLIQKGDSFDEAVRATEFLLKKVREMEGLAEVTRTEHVAKLRKSVKILEAELCPDSLVPAYIDAWNGCSIDKYRGECKKLLSEVFGIRTEGAGQGAINKFANTLLVRASGSKKGSNGKLAPLSPGTVRKHVIMATIDICLDNNILRIVEDDVEGGTTLEVVERKVATENEKVA